jgi:hypothetical protein
MDASLTVVNWVRLDDCTLQESVTVNEREGERDEITLYRGTEPPDTSAQEEKSAKQWQLILGRVTLR